MEPCATKKIWLSLDIGNSYVDWLLGPEWRGKAQDFASLVSQLPDKPKAVRMACVRRQHQQEWSRFIHKQWQLQPRIARVREEPIRLAYKDSQQLGVDRWLGLLALYHQNRRADWMLVDAGTALTIDFLNSEKHLGGFIGPGIELMRDSCAARIDEGWHGSESDDKYGKDTESCIRLGSWNMAKSFIHRQWQDFLSLHPAAKLVLTGGDGEELYRDLVSAGQIGRDNSGFEPFLVCRGLAYAFD